MKRCLWNRAVVVGIAFGLGVVHCGGADFATSPDASNTSDGGTTKDATKGGEGGDDASAEAGGDAPRGDDDAAGLTPCLKASTCDPLGEICCFKYTENSVKGVCRAAAACDGPADVAACVPGGAAKCAGKASCEREMCGSIVLNACSNNELCTGVVAKDAGSDGVADAEHDAPPDVVRVDGSMADARPDAPGTVDACNPKSCPPASCGSLDTGCGSVISCGTCASSGVCVTPDAGGVGSCCKPGTCEGLYPKECGMELPDGCGGTLMCNCPGAAGSTATCELSTTPGTPGMCN